MLAPTGTLRLLVLLARRRWRLTALAIVFYICERVKSQYEGHKHQQHCRLIAQP